MGAKTNNYFRFVTIIIYTNINYMKIIKIKKP